MRRALEIDEQSYGQEHPSVAIASTILPPYFKPRTDSPKPNP